MRDYPFLRCSDHRAQLILLEWRREVYVEIEMEDLKGLR